MRLWTYTARESCRRPGRALLTLAGISLGLATVVATQLTIPTVQRAYRELFEGLTGRAALEVTAPGLAGFDPAVTNQLKALPGVKALIPRIQATASVVGTRGSIPAPVLGIDPQSMPATAWQIRDGTALAGPDDVLLDAGMARALGLLPGAPVKVWTPTGLVQLRLAGTLESRGPAAAVGGILVMPLARAQALFALPGQVNSVQIVLADGGATENVQAAAADLLPAGIGVQAAGARSELAQTTLLATEQGLDALGILALTAAAFVILNTFLLNLGERRRQFAVLRALGATGAQVRRLLLREALLFGLAGTVLGCAGGVALAWALVPVMGQFLAVTLPGPHLTAGPFLLAVVLGPGAALLAAGIPAWCASRRQPLDDLLPQRGQACDHVSRRVALGGLFLLIGGIALAGGLCRGWVPQAARTALLAPALALLLTGGVLTLPAISGPLLYLAGRLPLGLTCTLAAQQLARRRTRTGLTAGVLFLALAVAVGFGHCLRGILLDLKQWCRQTVVADYLIRGSMPDTAFVLVAALPESLAADLARQKDVGEVVRAAFLPAQANDRPVLVLARDYFADQPLTLDLREGTPAAVLQGLRAGEVVLATGLAQQLKLHAGDLLTLQTPHGPKQLRIAGTATEYAAGGSAVHIEWHTAKRLLGLPGVHVFLVSARAGEAAALAPILRQFCERHHLLLQSNAEFAAMIDGLQARASGLLWALMALVFVLASLGIVNTLTMNVQEQTRELGVLRALGMKRGQVRRLVLTQAGLLGVIGLIPGAVAGLGLAYLINRGASWVGPPVDFRIDGLVVSGGCVLALAIALAAALWPARQAARLPVIRALLEG
jgi:putative ABC transport system permease protein